ncbi:MAG: YHS domain-containing protein [Chlamydiales bacterium]|jgi:YHS domain-containing protein
MNLTSTVLALAATVLASPLIGCGSAPVAIVAQGSQGVRPDLEQQNVDRDGLAIAGYDPVSYFEGGASKPQRGKPEHSLLERGVTYRFATAENLELFKSTPGKYEPAYGGWCAYAVAKGSKVEIDPRSFLIQDGRLLLFYKSFLNDTRKTWGKTPGEFGVHADEYWAKLIQAE